jgi:short-subunit dehydrogenase
MTAWTTASIPSQSGMLAIVTGATGGLGYEIALALAGAGAQVILSARDMNKFEKASRLITDKHPGASGPSG